MSNFEHITVLDVQRKLYYIDSREKIDSGKRTQLLKLFQRLEDIGDVDKIEQARFGLARHFFYSDKNDLAYDVETVREILNDALAGLCTSRALQRELEARKYAMPSAESFSFLGKMFAPVKGKGRRSVLING